jgi:hypothetical protein
MAERARELGRLVSFVAFSEAAPTGTNYAVST